MAIPNVNNLKKPLPDAQLPVSKRPRVESWQDQRVNERVLQTHLQPSRNGGGSSSSVEVFESNNFPPNSQEVQYVQQTAGRHFSSGVANHTPQTNPDGPQYYFELALQTSPDRSPYYHELTVQIPPTAPECHTPQTDPDGPLFGYESAAQTPQNAPEYPYAQHVLGISHFNVGDYQRAIKHLNIALLRYNNSDTENLADLQYFRCLCYCKLGKFEEALVCSKIFLELADEANLTSYDLIKSKLDDIYFQVGKLAFNQKNFLNAIDFLKRVSSTSVHESESQDFLGSAYYFLGCRYMKNRNFDEAIVVFSNVSERYEPALQKLAECFFSKGMFTDARNCFEKVTNPNSKYYQGSKCMLGLICLRLEDPTGAFEHFKHVADPKWYGEAQYALGNFYTKKKQYEKAKQCFFLVPFRHHHYGESHKQIDDIIRKQIEAIDQILNGQQ